MYDCTRLNRAMSISMTHRSTTRGAAAPEVTRRRPVLLLRDADHLRRKRLGLPGGLGREIPRPRRVPRERLRRHARPRPGLLEDPDKLVAQLDLPVHRPVHLLVLGDERLVPHP